jgi:hypothetical protein
MDKLDALRLAEDTRDIGHAIKLLQNVDQKLVSSTIRIGRIVRALREIKSAGERRIAKQFLRY